MKLEAHDLACARGGRTIFQGLGFALGAGEALAVTGPNGAGKSSLLRTLAGFIAPSRGRVTLEGGRADTPLAEQCHFIGHLNGIRKSLSVEENLAFWAGYYGAAAETDGALARFGLEDIADISAGLLSAGQARRLSLARLLRIERPVWLLDEPAASLDAASTRILADVIRGHLKAGGIVVASLHGSLGVKFTRTLELGRREARA